MDFGRLAAAIFCALLVPLVCESWGYFSEQLREFRLADLGLLPMPVFVETAVGFSATVIFGSCGWWSLILA